MSSDEHSGPHWLINGESVYGTILAAGLVAGISHFVEDPVELLLATISTILVFSAAHAFAEVIADASPDARATIRRALLRSAGLLWAVIPLTAIMVLAAAGVIRLETAVDLEIWLSIGLLTVLGYIASLPKTERVWVRLLCGAASGVLGAVVILLKELVH